MFHSLQSRLLAFVVTLLAATVLVIGFLFFAQLKSRLLDDIESEARGTTHGYAFAISEWLSIRSSMIASLRPVAGRPEAGEVFARYAEAGGFDLVYAGSPDKRMVFSKPQDVPAGYDPTIRPWYQGAEKAGPNAVFVSKPYIDAFTGALIMSISAVVQEGGKTRAVVANDMAITQVAKEILAARLPGDGYAFVLHKDGTVLVHPKKDLVLKAVTDFVPGLTPERQAQAVKDGRLFSIERTDGLRYLFLAPVKDSDWVLGVSLPTSVVDEPLNRLLMTLVGVILAVCVIAAALAGMVTRGMLGNLRQIRDRMREIAKGGGDLGVRLHVVSGDEIGETAEAFNSFLGQLGTMFASLRTEANQLAEGVDRLNGFISTIAKQSEQLSDTMSANAAAIEEVTVAVSHIADNATDVDRLMRDTGDLSHASVRDVDAVAADAEQSARQVEEMAGLLQSLDKRSQEIASIVNVIKGIADQTNLLALNAAIEAARAGEQGRGFAVVADEVRKLAEGTAKATIEIATMIDAIRDETSLAGRNMGAAVDTVRRGVNVSQAAAAKIGDIERKIGEAVSRVGEIALSTGEQRSATSAMAQSTENINGLVLAEDEAIQQARRELASLADNAGKTRQLLSAFRS